MVRKGSKGSKSKGSKKEKADAKVSKEEIQNGI